MLLEENWNNQNGDNVCDLDHRVDSGAGSVLVRITYRVAGYGCGMGKGAFPAQIAFLDKLLRIVPGTAARCHGNCNEQSGDNCADEHSTQHDRSKECEHRYYDHKHNRQ